VSPGLIVTDEGEKQRQLLPIVTVTMAALATLGRNARSGAMISSNTAMRSEKVFIRSISHGTLQTICCRMQQGKSNDVVTFL
jgi:hypothetical protein